MAEFKPIRLKIRMHGVDEWFARVERWFARAPFKFDGRRLRSAIKAAFRPLGRTTRQRGGMVLHIRPRVSAKRFVESLRAA